MMRERKAAEPLWTQPCLATMSSNRDRKSRSVEPDSSASATAARKSPTSASLAAPATVKAFALARCQIVVQSFEGLLTLARSQAIASSGGRSIALAVVTT